MKVDGWLAATSAGLGLLALTAIPSCPALIWNRTSSMPTGLYVLAATSSYVRGDTIAYLPTPMEAAFLEERRYTGRAWPLVKRVAALEGDTVCRFQREIYVNDRKVAEALETDAAGYTLPAWQGCKTLSAGDAFLLSDHPRSIDGRYLGTVSRGRVLGKVHHVLADKPTCLPAADTGCRIARTAPGISHGKSDGGR